MAVLGNSYFDLVDLYRSMENGKTAATIIELLAQKNPVMLDALLVECNEGKKHKTTIRTGLPSATWTALYEGIAQSKSQRQQVEDTTGTLEALSTIDTRLLKHAKDPEKIRMSEADAFFETLAQEWQQTFFYGDTATTPRKFKGLGARLNTYGTSGISRQVIHGGASGSDNTSIFMVEWSDHGCHFIYPEGSQAGITREDKGEQRVFDASGNPYYVKEDHFGLDIGCTLRDYRRCARIANIDVSEMIAGNVDLFALLRQGFYRLHDRRLKDQTYTQGMDQPRDKYKLCIYMNTTVMEQLDAQQTNNDKVRLRPIEVQGEEVMSFRGIPIRETDAILNTEDLVPAAA